jgi:ribosomal protein S18 acetylase RimI-like enzyme
MIRPYAPADLPAIVDIGNMAWREIYRMLGRCYGDELFRLLVPDADSVKGEQIRAHCQSHPDWVLICEEGGLICGFVTFRLDPDRGIGEIGNNAVRPELRGQGLAQQLYAAALGQFRQAGLRFAKVHTGMDEAHAPARRAYEKAGFGLRHEDVDYYQKL